MRRTIPGRSCAILALTVLLLPAGSAQATDWAENINVLVRVDGEPSGLAHVYDSDDYQTMLLIVEDRTAAALLDLPTQTVYAVARDSIRVDDDGTASSGELPEEYLTTLEHRGGTLEFLWEGSTVAIEPLPPLVGAAKLEEIFALKPTYEIAAKSYQPDSTMVALLRGIKEQTDIRVYFGTWCHLCTKLVPLLIGTLDRVGNPQLRTTYYGVDEDLSKPAEEIARDLISATPTIVLLRGSREIGRIEEEVTRPIEAELVDLLLGQR